VDADAANDAHFEAAARDGHFMFDLPGYTRRRLEGLGLADVETAPDDTCADGARFFSYRRATKLGEADYGRGLSAIMLAQMRLPGPDVNDFNTLAEALLQHNPDWQARMLLLEKARHPREKLCGGGITRYGEALLADLGLAIGVPTVDVREMRICFEGTLVGITHEPVFRVTRRAEFDAWLCERARERGLQIHEDEAVRNVAFVAGGVQVTTGQNTYQARVLVGADGSNGIVRAQTGLQSKGRVARLLEVVTPEDPAASPSHAAVRCGPLAKRAGRVRYPLR